MKISNIKVKTPSIPSRTAANQFIDEHGYDMEFWLANKLFFIHDTQKNKLHGITIGEVTNFTVDTAEPAAFMAKIRAKLTANEFDELAKKLSTKGKTAND